MESLYSFMVDDSGELTINDVIKPDIENKFIKAPAKALNLGVTNSTAWIRFTLHNPENRNRTLVLKLGTSTIDVANLYDPTSDGKFIVHKSGQLHDADMQDYFYRTPNFRIKLAPFQNKTLYLQMHTVAILETTLTLVDENIFVSRLPGEYLLLGLFYAAFLVAIAYNFFLYISLRDQSRLLYVLYAGVFCVMWFYLDGLWHQFNWPVDTVDILTGIRMANAGTLLCMVLFTDRFFGCKTKTPRLHKWLMTLAIVCAVNVVMVNFLPLAQYKAPLRLAWLFSIPSVLFTGCLFWKRGMLRARYFVIAWVLVLMGAAMFLSNMYLSLFPNNFFVRHAWRIASVMEIILLSLALADRINELNREKELAQARALTAERNLIQGLETQVAERTKKLEQANRQLERISQLDELTGLYNRRYFEHALSKEWNRMKRSQDYLCVIMLDVDYFKEYNDSNGHQAGDICLQSIAKSLSVGTKRASDVSARYGGEEFALILPTTNAEGGKIIAEDVRKHIQEKHIPHSEKISIVTASFGVASVIPTEEDTPEILLKRADDALYQSKHGGRNQVTVR